MKILLYTNLAIRPDQLFWPRDFGHNALLVVHLATEPRTTPAISNELDHPREQPFGAQQDLPRLSALGRQPCVAQQGLPRPSVAGPHPTSATSSKIKNPKSSIQDDPVLWVSQQDIRDPLWWQSQKPHLVILGL